MDALRSHGVERSTTVLRAAGSCGCRWAGDKAPLIPHRHPRPAGRAVQASVPKTGFRQNPSSSAKELKLLVLASPADLPEGNCDRECSVYRQKVLRWDVLRGWDPLTW